MPPRLTIRELPDIWRTRIPLGNTGLLASGPVVRLVVHNQGDQPLENLQARLLRIVCLGRPQSDPDRVIAYRGEPLNWGGMGPGQPKTLPPDAFGFLELIRAMDLNLLLYPNGMVANGHPELPPGKYWQVCVSQLLEQAMPELHPFSGRFAMHFDFTAYNLAEPLAKTAVLTCREDALVPEIEVMDRGGEEEG